MTIFNREGRNRIKTERNRAVRVRESRGESTREQGEEGGHRPRVPWNRCEEPSSRPRLALARSVRQSQRQKRAQSGLKRTGTEEAEIVTHKQLS